MSQLILNRLVGVPIILLFLVPTAPAQSAGSILKRSAKALGGEKALKKVGSWQIRGRITHLASGESGAYLASAMKPDLYAGEFDVRGLEVGFGYNGKSGWMRDSRDGLRTMTGDLSRDFQAETAWRNYRWLNAGREKAKIAFAEKTTVNGKPANVLLFTTARNVRIRIYFDAATHLPVREEIPAGTALKTYDYADYRSVNGILEPHTITLTSDDQQFEIRIDEVRHNPRLERRIFEFPRLTDEPLPDIAELLEKVRANEEEIDRLLEKYTYTETITKRKMDSRGQVTEKESESYELTFYKGNRIRRLVARNGVPLSPGDEADETRKIEKRIREIEKKEAERERKEREVAQQTTGNPDPERGQRISIADVLRASRLVNPRRERFRGREVIVFDYEPLPGYKPQKDYEKFFGKTAGAIWIDASDRQVARVEARLVDSYKVAGGLLASLREGATFVLEQERVNNEIWLPTRADINLSVKVLLIKGISVNQTITYGNYKRFSVDTEKEKIKTPIPGGGNP
ncbi:MAG: hypothetical protein IPM66_02505 [Acidobacteriota bacterium]|nr:MAG: hypothetical protein IPM66_02505 [Acidobacteriota bacterium]